MGCKQFFADVSSKIIALDDPVLSQPDMEREVVSPPAGAYIPSFTIYKVLPDLPGTSGIPDRDLLSLRYTVTCNY